MTAVLELLITVLLVGGLVYGLWWALSLLRGKLPDPINVAVIIIFVVFVIVAIWQVGFKGFRIIDL